LTARPAELPFGQVAWMADYARLVMDDSAPRHVRTRPGRGVRTRAVAQRTAGRPTHTLANHVT